MSFLLDLQCDRIYQKMANMYRVSDTHTQGRRIRYLMRVREDKLEVMAREWKRWPCVWESGRRRTRPRNRRQMSERRRSGWRLPPPKRRRFAETEPAIDSRPHGCPIGCRDSGREPPLPPSFATPSLSLPLYLSCFFQCRSNKKPSSSKGKRQRRIISTDASNGMKLRVWCGRLVWLINQP